MKQNLNQEQNNYQEALNSIKEKTTEVDEYEAIPESTFCHCAEGTEVLQELINYVECLEKALDKMCRIFDEEIHDCDFLLIRNSLCDSKCTLCDQEKRVELMKEWVMNNAI